MANEQERTRYSIDFPYKTVHLNEEQFKVVTSDPYQNQRILASAGSGKTTTITARIAWLIHRHGIKADKIVLLTFSRNASREMSSRVKSLVGPVNIWSGTFHGLAKNILTTYGSTQTNYFIDELPVFLMQWMRTPKGREWVGKLRYIIVDEFQDINAIQWRLLETMRHYGVHITIVGDDAQNIYTWRGSSAGFLLDLHNSVKNLHDYQLRQNYRSTDAIVAAANSIMRLIPTLEWKEQMVAHKKGGQKPDVMFFWRLADECLWISKTIQELRRINPKQTIAIIARNNVDLYRVEEVLLQQGLSPRILALDPTDDIQEHLQTKDSVDLATFHGSKGLEWDAVFCICLSDDQLPSRKRAQDIIGERRLFYVAVTRAKERLFLTYHGNERNLSRFVREIGYKLLTFHGLANYAFSEIEVGLSCPTIERILDCLDGDDWQLLRTLGLLPWSETIPLTIQHIFPPGEQWRIPEWAEERDFEAFVRLFIKRCIYQYTTTDEPYHDPMIERMLFTLRIFQEDREFWSQWRTEIDSMVKYFFKDSAKMPAAGYADIDAYIKKLGLVWSQNDIVHATTILAKLRGQLRPLRFDAYSLEEFTICPARVVAPTEYRADILRSWRAFQNKNVSWKECIVDIWRLACLEQVADGRNAGLFRIASLKKTIDDCIPFLEMLEYGIINYMQDSIKGCTLNPEIAADGLGPCKADCTLDSRLLRLCGSRKPDLYMWIESSLIAYVFMTEGCQVIKTLQSMHPFHGTIMSLPMPPVNTIKKLFDTLMIIWEKKQC